MPRFILSLVSDLPNVTHPVFVALGTINMIVNKHFTYKENESVSFQVEHASFQLTYIWLIQHCCISALSFFFVLSEGNSNLLAKMLHDPQLLMK